MKAKSMSLKTIKDKMLRLLVSHSAASLFDAYVQEFYDGEALSADDYAELRKKVAKQSRSSLLLVLLKR